MNNKKTNKLSYMSNQQAIQYIQDHMNIHHIGTYPHIKIGMALEKAISLLSLNIVFCKNCKYRTFYEFPESGRTIYYCRNENGLDSDEVFETDFCSRGENI